MSGQGFIAIEWGTARVVARRIDGKGQLLTQTERLVRLVDLDRTGIAALLENLCTELAGTSPPAPIWLAGMIGSSLGWREVARVACPASAADIRLGVQVDRIGDIAVAFVPGLSCVSSFGDADVMRGEEVSALGVLGSYPDQRTLMLSAPGMHGKWIELRNGAIQSFHTAMTVEIANVLSEHSVLRSHINSPPVGDDVFRAGVQRGLEGGSLARLIFSVRSAVLSGRIEPDQAASHLWGVLIGAEIQELQFQDYDQVLLGGTGSVTILYQEALRCLGIPAVTINGDFSAQGFARLRSLSHFQSDVAVGS
jgi:2-dehydro-3-deoxygalactonokinase